MRFKNKLEFFNWVEELRERHTKKNFLSSQLDSEAFFEDMYKVYQEQDNIIQTQDQEIQALKANKQRFNELLEQDPALNKAYNQALEA